MSGATGRAACSVCSDQPGEAGGMQCGHSFCHDCYARYVDGSVEELRTHLRCCICGWLNILVTEVKDEMPINDFGRNREPRLMDPVGMCMRRTGDFVVADSKLKRIFIYDRRGSSIRDFAHLHNFRAMVGTAVTAEDRIVVPLANGTASILAFYTIEGGYLRSAYLPPGCAVSGLVVTSENLIIVTDSAGSCLHFLDENDRMSHSLPIPQLQGEKSTPVPNGIALNSLEEIIVSDAGNHCIKVFDSEGKFLHKIGQEGERAGQFRYPAGITVDECDRIIIADKGNQRVQLFNKRGSFLCFIVRYNTGHDVYVAPIDVTSMGNYGIAILLRGTKDALAGETRIYEYKTILKDMNYHSELSNECLL